MLTQENLKKMLHYDTDTGVFTRLVRTSSRTKIGDIAGYLKSDGYRLIMVDGKNYYAHRLAFFYMTGDWPVADIDHRNGVRDDNRWDNLREATRTENHQNRVMRSDNTSGFIGVDWHRQRGKWRAEIAVAGRRKSLGYFPTPEEAHAAYCAAKVEFHTFQPTGRNV